MGLKYRTPIGTLRDQRRKAESQLPLNGGRGNTLRFRNTDSLGDQLPTAGEYLKREHLIERLRNVLAADKSNAGLEHSEYEAIQDELARISQHQAASRQDGSKHPLELMIPKNMFIDSPFRYVIINGGKSSGDFESIPKLTSAPVNLDA